MENKRVENYTRNTYYEQVVSAGLTFLNIPEKVRVQIKQFINRLSTWDCQIAALAQLSREVESSASKDSKHLPSLRHLRESGAIEQDADIVSFVYRPAYYGIETWDDGRETLGRGFILIGKNRDGELGACEFRHNPELTKIFDPPRVGAATPGVFPESKDVFLDNPPF